MSKGRIVSFRVADEHYAQLTERSKNGGSPGSYAREVLLQALHDESIVNDIRLKLDRQEILLAELKQELRQALYTALVACAGCKPERAAELVKKGMNTGGSDAFNLSSQR